MARKRLTSSTLQDSAKLRLGGQAVDLAARLLGSGASDQELVATGRFLTKVAGGKGIQTLHKLASRIATESGEDFPGDLVDEGEYDPRDTQEFVAEHEVTPDHSVLDVVLHENNPTQNPTASRKAGDDEEPDLEEPDEVEEDLEDHVEDDNIEGEDIEDLGDDVEDLDDDIEDLDKDETDLEDDEHDVDEHVVDVNDDEEMADLGDDDGDFTLDDMEELENLGVDGVLTSSADEETRVRRTRDGGVIKGRQAHRLAEQDAERDAAQAYEESLEVERRNARVAKQTRRVAKPTKPVKAQKPFRPARTRVASPENNANEFDQVWSEPDVSSAFDS